MKIMETKISQVSRPKTEEYEIKKSFNNGPSYYNKIISGPKKGLIELLIRNTIVRIVFSVSKNPIKSVKVLIALDRLRRKVLGKNRIKKIVRVGKNYYWDLYTPGWPSNTFSKFIKGEVNRITPLKIKTNRFTNIFLAVTKKCSLQCEHCFEWDALNGKEKLTLSDLKDIVSKFQDKGTGQFQLTGGEPLLRLDDIVELLIYSKKESDFWVLTSGYNLTYENGKKLKEAGLTGVVISLDHFEKNEHNAFRRNEKAYEWALKAVENSIANNLVTALSICVTRSFVSDSNLMKYAELAKNMGVAFIQILEPKAVGHYLGKDVLLYKEHEKILESFYFKMNYNKKHKDYPIVTYHGYHQRQIGCFASGDRNLYVDTDGDIHACPFCHTKKGSVLLNDLDSSIENLKSNGCHSYNNSNI